MTRFWRDGFWRTSALGNTHWVEGHWVDRDDWERAYSLNNNEGSDRYFSNLGVTSSLVSRWVNPNATCPVCGESVFFYQNEYGSRVFFDDLGPPWPKHPCTDNQEFQFAPYDEDCHKIRPVIRDSTSISIINTWLEVFDWHLEDDFFSSYGLRPWECWEIELRRRGTDNTLLVLSSVADGRLMYLAANRLPRALKKGLFVFYKRLHLSYFDVSHMEPVTVEVERLSSAQEFVLEQL